MRGKLILGVLAGTALCGSLFFATNTSSPERPGAAQAAQKDPGDRLIDSIEGPALYKAYCAVCHGADAKGNGPMAPALRARPTDLTGIAARNKNEFPMAHIEKIISGEEVVRGGHGTKEMPIWGPIFSQVDRDQDLGRVRIDNLTRYLKEIQGK